MGTYYMKNDLTLMFNKYFYISYENYEKNEFNLIWIC